MILADGLLFTPNAYLRDPWQQLDVCKICTRRAPLPEMLRVPIALLLWLAPSYAYQYGPLLLPRRQQVPPRALCSLSGGGGDAPSTRALELHQRLARCAEEDTSLGRAVKDALQVLSDDPYTTDERTYHEAVEVIKGRKYAANFWIHMFEFQEALKRGCEKCRHPPGFVTTLRP